MSTTPSARAIELRVERISQLFNALDPYPFVERDLDKDAEDFIVGWARELKPDASIQIVVHLPASEAGTQNAQKLAQAFSSYFSHRSQMITFELKELLRVGRWSLAIGLAVLAFCLLTAHAIGNKFGSDPFAQIAQESLFIVGWVANWRPIEIFLYDWLPISRKRRLYRRLALATVELHSMTS